MVVSVVVLMLPKYLMFDALCVCVQVVIDSTGAHMRRTSQLPTQLELRNEINAQLNNELRIDEQTDEQLNMGNSSAETKHNSLSLSVPQYDSNSGPTLNMLPHTPIHMTANHAYQSSAEINSPYILAMLARENMRSNPHYDGREVKLAGSFPVLVCVVCLCFRLFVHVCYCLFICVSVCLMCCVKVVV